MTFAALGGAFDVPAVAAEISNIRAGFDQRVKLGTWTQLDVEVRDGAQDLKVVAIVPDCDGNRVEWPLEAAPDRPGRYVGVVQLGRLDGTIDVEVRQGEAIMASAQLGTVLKDAQKLSAFRYSTEFWGVLGPAEGFNSAAESRTALARRMGGPAAADGAIVVPLTLADLPANVDAWSGLNVIVLSGSALRPTDAQNELLQKWVQRGGRLVLLLGDHTEAFLSGPLAKWMPIKVLGVNPRVDKLDNVNSLIPGSVRIGRIGVRDSIAAARFEPPADSTSVPVLVRGSYGTGTVTAFAYDLDHRPLSVWEPLGELCQLLVSPENAFVQREAGESELTSTGISDLGSQLLAGLDQFSDVNRQSLGRVLGWTFAWILLLGPIDYLLVHRLLRRPQLTWVTLPIWIVVATFAGARTATASNSAPLTLNQIDVVDVEPEIDAIRGRTLFTFYSNENARYEISAASSVGNTPATLCWAAKPEEGLRGLYRSGGISFGNPSYEINNARTEIHSLPVRTWSSATLSAEWEQPQSSTLVESALRDDGTGRLKGTVTHRFPEPLTDWAIYYRHYVYYPAEPTAQIANPSWAAGQKWGIDGNVPQTLITGYLTGRREVVRRATDTKQVGTSVLKDSYNALEWSPFRLVRMISLHKLAGGPDYTSLTNSALASMDLSRVIQLENGVTNHAVLFARIKSPATNVTVDGKAVAPAEHWTFVRVILPVSQSAVSRADQSR